MAYFYAEINENNICTTVKMVSGEILLPNHIKIESADYDYYSFRKYENGEWSKEKYIPDYAQIELDRMEKLEQSQADQDEIIMQLMLGGR